MSDQKITVRNSQTSLFDWFCLLVFICWIMQVSGCEDCKETKSGTECAGKVIGSVYKEVKQGFEKGSQ